MMDIFIERKVLNDSWRRFKVPSRLGIARHLHSSTITAVMHHALLFLDVWRSSKIHWLGRILHLHLHLHLLRVVQMELIVEVSLLVHLELLLWISLQLERRRAVEDCLDPDCWLLVAWCLRIQRFQRKDYFNRRKKPYLLLCLGQVILVALYKTLILHLLFSLVLRVRVSLELRLVTMHQVKSCL